MKAIYQKPMTDIVTISVGHLMNGGSNNYGKPEQGQNLNEAGTTDQTSGNLSRRRTVWDDEEEDEYDR